MRVICVKVMCKYEQFVSGAAHNKALEIAKKFIHTDLKLSSEDFDLVCFNKLEGHFISNRAWKLDCWNNAEVVDISNDLSVTNEED